MEACGAEAGFPAPEPLPLGCGALAAQKQGLQWVTPEPPRIKRAGGPCSWVQVFRGSDSDLELGPEVRPACRHRTSWAPAPLPGG